MGRIIGPVCRLCRAEGVKLFLKGPKCLSDKCTFHKKASPPGMHLRKRPQMSDHRTQLREKQKLQRMSGMFERQFRRFFQKAEKTKGMTGENLLVFLERRLDNVCYHLGWGLSRPAARQLIRHGHILVNGKKVNIPSFLVKIGDKISVKDKIKQIPQIIEGAQFLEKRGLPGWLEMDKPTGEGVVKRYPTRPESSFAIKEQLIVEYYSKH